MKQTAVKYGIMTGMATMLYLFFFYLVNPENAIKPWVSLSTLLLLVIGMVSACVKQRNNAGGKLERKEALKTSFLIAIISGLFFYAFMYVLFIFIDPGLNELLTQKELTQNTGMESQPYVMTLGKVIFGYAFSLIYGFFLSLMVANFVKK